MSGAVVAEVISLSNAVEYRVEPRVKNIFADTRLAWAVTECLQGTSHGNKRAKDTQSFLYQRRPCFATISHLAEFFFRVHSTSHICFRIILFTNTIIHAMHFNTQTKQNSNSSLQVS